MQNIAQLIRVYGHKNNSQIWILCVINNSSKDFKIEGVLYRDSFNLMNFITNNIPIGSKVVMDSLYNFLDMANSGYSGGQF